MKAKSFDLTSRKALFSFSSLLAQNDVKAEPKGRSVNKGGLTVSNEVWIKPAQCGPSATNGGQTAKDAAISPCVLPANLTEWVAPALLASLALQSVKLYSKAEEPALQDQLGNESFDSLLATLTALVYGCAVGSLCTDGGITSLVLHGRGKVEIDPDRIRCLCNEHFQELKLCLAYVFESAWDYRVRTCRADRVVPNYLLSVGSPIDHTLALQDEILREADRRIRFLRL